MKVLRTAEEAIQFAAETVRRHLPDPAYRIFLFGSRAAGTAHTRSDIDIGIEGPGPVRAETLAALHDEFDEAPTLYTIDLVDFRRMSAEFRQIARTRVPL